ncbi:hypothetical protein V6W80_09885 [Pseudomonas benzopyrenica]|uniref:Four helix bundle sensory module for signal transduction n=1 Tax=Pseudomonas benzopyrenica TaxID=2993566 RepID=A0ABZ2FXW7_9PSED
MRVNKKRARMVLSVLSFVVIVFSLAATIGAQTYEDIARRSSLATTLEAVEGKLGDTIGNSGLELQDACNKTARDETSEKIRLSKQADDERARIVGFRTSNIDYEGEDDRLYRMAFKDCAEHDPRYTAYLYKGYESAANYRGMIKESISKAGLISAIALIFATIISTGIGYLVVNWIPAAIKAAYKWIAAPENS